MQINIQIAILDQIIENYLQASHNSSSIVGVEAASNDLTSFSKREIFLKIAFFILLNSECEQEKNILLTTLIKDKFKYDFQTIEFSQLQTYYDSLCELVFKIKYENSAISKQISLALAYLYINFCSIQLMPLEQYLNPILPSNGRAQELFGYSNYYFKVLQYIASEVYNSRLVLDYQSRQNVKNYILGQQGKILEMLNQRGGQFWEGSRIMRQTIIQCFTSWVDLAYKPEILNSLPHHSLMPKMFESLLDYYESVIAAQSFKIIINKIQDPNDNAPIIEYLGFNLVQLVSQIQRHLSDKEIYDAQIYLSLLLQFSTKAIHNFVDHPNSENINFLNHLINFTKINGLYIYNEFVQFWELFLEQIYKLSQQKQGEQVLAENIVNVVYGVYGVICYRCRFSESTISRFQIKQEKAILQENPSGQQTSKRREISLVIFQLIAKIVTHQVYASLISKTIQQLDTQNQNFWSNFEVTIFSLILPLKKISFINGDINLIINTFHQLNTKNVLKTPILVKRTYLKVFRSLMGSGLKNGIIIQKLFYYCSTCFDIPLLAEQADRTFCEGCELNCSLMVGNIVDFISLMRAHINRQYIVKGVFYIILSSSYSIQNYLLSSLILIRESIENCRIRTPQRKQAKHILNSICRLLKDSKIVENHLNIVKQFVRRSFSFILTSLNNTQQTRKDENFEVERTVKLVKFLMRTLREQFWEFVPEIFQSIMNSFRASPICSYVYLVEVAITVFSKEKMHESDILDIYNQFCRQSSRHLSNIQNIEMYSFLLDDFIGMNKRLFIYNPSIVLRSNQLAPLISQCLECIESETPRIVKAVYTFFESMFMAYWRTEFIEIYNKEATDDPLMFSNQGAPLYLQLKNELHDKIHYILAKMLIHLTTIPSELISECIFASVMAEIKAFPDLNADIWGKLIDPMPNYIFLTIEKQEFMSYINQTSQNDFGKVRSATKSLEKMIELMYKRMNTANKRKNYDIKK